MTALPLRASLITPLLWVGSALLIAFYGSVWQIVYSVGVPTGLASSLAQGVALMSIIAALLIGRRLIRRHDIALFACLTVGGGLGGAIGSIVGNAGGPTWLRIGGLIGGIATSIGVVLLASRLRWIGPGQVRLTAVAAALGFVIASVVALNTLSSPIGPIAASTIIGALGVAGAWHHAHD